MADQETKKKRRVPKIVKFLVLALLFLCAVVGAFVLALIFILPFRMAVRDFVVRTLGSQVMAQFDQVVFPLRDTVSAWVADARVWLGGLGDQIGERWGEVCAWWGSVHLDQAVDNALSGLFGSGAPTVDQIGGQISSAIPQPPNTGDYISDVMLIVLGVCVVAIAVLLLLIRRSDARAAAQVVVMTSKPGRRWWVWLFALVAFACLLAVGFMTFMTGQPGWIVLTFILFGFTVRTLQADV